MDGNSTAVRRGQGEAAQRQRQATAETVEQAAIGTPPSRATRVDGTDGASCRRMMCRSPLLAAAFIGAPERCPTALRGGPRPARDGPPAVRQTSPIARPAEA